jgi:hypothetical protein
MGDPIEIIIHEFVHKSEVSQYLPGLEQEPSGDRREHVDLFTYCKFNHDNSKWEVHQEMLEQTVPESEGSYTTKDFPYVPLTWQRDDGDNYGRGHVDDYLGDFMSYEELAKAICQAAGIAALTFFLVNPNGVTRKKDLEKAVNGGFVPGLADDISTLGLEKDKDFQVALQKAQDLHKELSQDFLLHTSVTRQAERVTAEEIRYMAQELEDSLGGIYSILAAELQLPLVNKSITTMGIKLPDDVDPMITTGFEALGRGHDLNKLRVFFSSIVESFGPEAVAQYCNVPDGIERLGMAAGIDTAGLVKTQEQIQQEQQAAQQGALLNQVAPKAMEMMTSQQQPQQEGNQ